MTDNGYNAADLPDLYPKAKWQVARGFMVAGWWATLTAIMVLVLAPVYMHLFTDKMPNDGMIALSGAGLIILKEFAVTIREFIAENT